MTYYCVAKKKTNSYPTGTIFRVWKGLNNTVYAIKQNFGNDPITLKAITINVGQPFTYSINTAKNIFTNPSKDLDDVIEDAILICEANYN